MLDWLKSVVMPPEPTGPPECFKRFSLEEEPIAAEGFCIEGDAWCFDCPGETPVRLFEIDEPGVENCLLTYRADLKTENAAGKVYLEMWCRFPGRGEFFSKGADQALKGTSDWSSVEIPFFLKAGQRPDLIKLNLAAEGEARVWVRNLQLLKTSYEHQ